jgi:hypothetical protein
MRTILHSRPLVSALRLAGLALLAACAGDAPTDPAETESDMLDSRSADRHKVSVCHKPDRGGAILRIGGSALDAHLRHGDYVTRLLVDQATPVSGDGVHFATIGAALDAARSGRLARSELVSAACRITIVVAAGTYPGVPNAEPAAGQERFPLLVDVPDITLRGAMEMTLDGAGRATGEAEGGAESVLSPASPLPVVAGASTPLILANAHPGGSAGHRLVVKGFVFRSGHTTTAGGQGVLSVRANDLRIRGNRFEAGFTESIDVRGGSAAVLENHLSGTAGTCDVCFAAPGTFRAVGNRLLAGGIPGFTVDGATGLPVPAGVEPFELPATAEAWAVIRNNEVRDHLRVPVGVGIRIDALGPQAPNVINTIHADIRDNVLVNNRFGIIVHAAFPVANTSLRSDVDVRLHGNTIEESCQAKLLVSLSRHTTALGLSNNPWLLGSKFELSLGGDLTWDEAWYGHDAGYGNTLLVDGQPIANGRRQFYSATTCVAS